VAITDLLAIPPSVKLAIIWDYPLSLVAVCWSLPYIYNMMVINKKNRRKRQKSIAKL
jgi:hypothetical protein